MTHDTELLKAARTGYAKMRDELNAKIADIDAQLLGIGPTRIKKATKSALPQRRRNVMSEEGKARIAAATRKRWAAFREAKQGAVA